MVIVLDVQPMPYKFAIEKAVPGDHSLKRSGLKALNASLRPKITQQLRLQQQSTNESAQPPSSQLSADSDDQEDGDFVDNSASDDADEDENEAVSEDSTSDKEEPPNKFVDDEAESTGEDDEAGFEDADKDATGAGQAGVLEDRSSVSDACPSKSGPIESRFFNLANGTPAPNAVVPLHATRLPLFSIQEHDPLDLSRLVAMTFRAVFLNRFV